MTMRVRTRDRVAGIAATALVLTLIGYALLGGLRMDFSRPVERTLTLLNLPTPRVQPPPPPVRPQSKPAKRKASPANRRGHAAEIVAPPPALPILVVPPVAVTRQAPGIGLAQTSGASDRGGPGSGAGGTGSGDGGGGFGDGDVPPRFVRGRLRYTDLPAPMREAAISGTVSVRYAVDVDGRVRGCSVAVSSGNADLDTLTCRLIEERFRYRPSRDGDGRPVRSIIEEKHSWIVDRDSDGGRD